VEQARRQSKQEGKPWVLVIAEHGDQAPIAVVDFKWLTSVLVPADTEPEATPE
jgi:hypothetical protein